MKLFFLPMKRRILVMEPVSDTQHQIVRSMEVLQVISDMDE